jgi:glycosyltransferase involved in cell wall biosynthesis
MWQAVAAARRRRIPLLVRGDSHLKTPRNRTKAVAKRMIYPVALRVFDAALYVGQWSKEYYEYYSYPADRLFFSPHCVDTAWFAGHSSPAAGRSLRTKLSISPDQRVVVFAGRLVELKRPLDLVDALGLLARRGTAVSLLVAGSGPLEDEIRRRAMEVGVSVYFLGFQNQSAMPAVYAAADVLALPSAHETWGLVVNEALACGTPVVVSDAVGCAIDLVADGSAGKIYPMGDWGRLAHELEALLTDPPSEAAIAAKSAAYGLDAACDGVMKALEFVRQDG